LKILVFLLILSLIVFFIGIGIILNSTDMADEKGSLFTKEQGGSADANQVLREITDSSNSYKLIGLTISIISGLGFLICCVGIYKNRID